MPNAAHGTPFKRPENGVFRPGTAFREFFFDETGDTNATSPENGGTATSVCTAGGMPSSKHSSVSSDLARRCAYTPSSPPIQ